MPDKLSPLQVFLSCFSVSSLAGLARSLRYGETLCWRRVLTTTLYSGIIGLLIGLLWYSKFEGGGNMFFLIGVSGLAGLGGTDVLELVIAVLKNKGIHVSISTGEPATPTDATDVDPPGESDDG